MTFKAIRLDEIIQVGNIEKKRGPGRTLEHSSIGSPVRGKVANI